MRCWGLRTERRWGRRAEGLVLYDTCIQLEALTVVALLLLQGSSPHATLTHPLPNLFHGQMVEYIELYCHFYR